MASYTNTTTAEAEGEIQNAYSPRPFPRREGNVSSGSQPALFYEGISSQFNTLVVISTFTTALIVSFLSLVDQLVDIQGSLAREIGMWLAFLACGVHLWVAIVSGRVALLALKAGMPEASLQPSSKKLRQLALTNEDYARFLVLCEQLQLAGTIIFAPAALILIQKVFTRLWLSVSLYAIAAVSVVLVFRAGFWKGSVLVANFMELGGTFSRLLGHAR